MVIVSFTRAIWKIGRRVYDATARMLMVNMLGRARSFVPFYSTPSSRFLSERARLFVRDECFARDGVVSKSWT